MKQVYLSRHAQSGISGLAILVLIMMCVFIGLGTWQLQRKAEKEAILSSNESHDSVPVVALPTELTEYAQWRYRKVVADGHYNGEKQFLLDNQIKDGTVGYNVLTPFRLTTQHWVLVDRGWVAQLPNREQRPDMSVAALPQSIQGEVYTPFSDGLRLGSVDNDQSGWPRVVQYIDYTQLAERFGQPLLPLILRLSPEASDGYRREWQTVAFGPERHLGYAVQWFGLALAMIIIFIILVRNKQ